MTEITAAGMVGEATATLLEVGFQSASELPLSDGMRVRCFEDAVSIVGVVDYVSWNGLQEGWLGAQSALVEFLSTRLDRNDPKVWDGYLVLLTLDGAPDPAEVDAIRRDTTRLRKIVATGLDIKQVSDVALAMLPVIPLLPGELHRDEGGVLSRLPGLLAERGIPEDLSAAVANAFESGQPLMEAVWAWRRQQ